MPHNLTPRLPPTAPQVCLALHHLTPRLPPAAPQVRLALHHLTRRKVAIKIIDKERLSDPNDSRRISREIRSAPAAPPLA